MTALAVCAPLVLAGPAAADRERRAWAHVEIIAHRGASAHAPENTLAAFRLAGRMGADLIELDVRQTRDGHLVVVHDRTLARTTDVERRFPRLKPWRVSDLTLKQIKSLDAGSWFGRRYRGERVPTLAETLRVVKAARLKALVELKNPEEYPGVTRRFVSQVKDDSYWTSYERLTVQSFSWRYVRAVNDALPAVRGTVLGRPDSFELLGVRWYAEAVHPAKGTVTAEYVRDAHQRWLDIYAYTVNDEETMLRLLRYGVDGITTDRPDLLRELRQES
ncbi:glycerophosphodiester phosphodiesterase [Actinocorallia populi]|uniref:glycerophosphodiester phosphodiesterase n=1 Tax=Actinocorallia populi TaxID=2079200 RepID=UPI001E2DC0A2|nr:glycerophosphodiester phosphodiesterase family protein [Actinocorallia populi]